MMKTSKKGYKKNSPDNKNPFNIIPSGNITMKGVPHPVMGVDNTGVVQMMMPGGEYNFPGSHVIEFPMPQGGGYRKQQGGPITLTSPIQGDTTMYQSDNVPRAVDKTQSYDPMDKATREWNAWIKANPVGSYLNPTPGITFEDWRRFSGYLPLEGQCTGPDCDHKNYGGGIKKYPGGGSVNYVPLDEQVVPGSARHKELMEQERQRQMFLQKQSRYQPMIDQFGQPSVLSVDQFKRKYPQASPDVPEGTSSIYSFQVDPSEGIIGTTPDPNIFSIAPHASSNLAYNFYPAPTDPGAVPEYDLFDPYSDIDMSLEPEPLYEEPKIPQTPKDPQETIKQKPGAWYQDAQGNWVQAPVMTTLAESGMPSLKKGGSKKFDMSKMFRDMAEKRKKDFGGPIVPQGMGTDDIIAKNRNMFTHYLSNNMLGHLAMEEADGLGMQMMHGNNQPGMDMAKCGGPHKGYMQGGGGIDNPTANMEYLKNKYYSDQGITDEQGNVYTSKDLYATQTGNTPAKTVFPNGNYVPPVRPSEGESSQMGYGSVLSNIPGWQGYNMFPMNFSPYYKMKGSGMNFAGIPNVNFDPSQVYLKDYQYKGRLFGQGPRKVSMTFSPFQEGVTGGIPTGVNTTGGTDTKKTPYDQPTRLSLKTRIQNFLQEQQAERERKRRMKNPEFETAVHPYWRMQVGGDVNKLPMTPISKIPQNIEMPAFPNMNTPQGDITLEWKRKMGINPQEAVGWGLTGINALSAFGENMDVQRNKQLMQERMNADALFQPVGAGAASRGTYDPNTGAFRPHAMTPVQFSGMNFGQVGSPMSFKQGGEYDLSQAEIDQILASGGSIEYID